MKRNIETSSSFSILYTKGRARDFGFWKADGVRKDCLLFKGNRNGERLITSKCTNGIIYKRKVLCQTVSSKFIRSYVKYVY